MKHPEEAFEPAKPRILYGIVIIMPMLFVQPSAVFGMMPVIAPDLPLRRLRLVDEAADVLQLPPAQVFLILRGIDFHVRDSPLPLLHDRQAVQILAGKNVDGFIPAFRRQVGPEPIFVQPHTFSL